MMSHKEFIDLCYQCAVICESCAAACLNEEDVADLTLAIELNRDCADICRQVAAFVSRDSLFGEALCSLCADICEASGDECAKHQRLEQCEECAIMCYQCAEACRSMMAHNSSRI